MKTLNNDRLNEDVTKRQINGEGSVQIDGNVVFNLQRWYQAWLPLNATCQYIYLVNWTEFMLHVIFASKSWQDMLYVRIWIEDIENNLWTGVADWLYAEERVLMFIYDNPEINAHGVNMGPIWGQQDPGGTHVGPINLVFLEYIHIFIFFTT